MGRRRKKVHKVYTFFSRSNQIAFRLLMGNRVKIVREKLNAMAEDRMKFGLVVRLDELQVKNKREETHSFVPLDIGREKDKDIVLKLLRCDVEPNVSTVSIVGIGGMGKTTLAQLVHKAEKESRHFELVMWVCVSNVFDVKSICRSIIKSATGKDCTSSEMEGVKDELKKAIDGIRYLLVLDDVWNEDPMEWLKMEDLLLDGAKRSRILVTTRTELVAKAVRSSMIHVLKGLSGKESWSFFKQMAFGQGQEPHTSRISAIGNEIVEKCSGVPLALKAIGSMLREKEKESDWLYFKKNKLPKITQESTGGIMPILKLSYDYLSPPLKQCFAYCAVFPKDHTIFKDTLIQMWMVLGYVLLSGKDDVEEEAGEQYFTELLKRSFFQEFETDEKGRDHCKMHDLIHDLAQSLLGNEICAMVWDGIDATTRHVWANKGVQTFPVQKVKNLRTCMITEEISSGLELKKIVYSLERIRVLGMRLKVPKLPTCIGSLMHISYLDLSYGSFVQLPESIGNLHSLQTLKLEYCTKLEELPRRTKDVVSLRHLDIRFCYDFDHMPRGLGKLTSLQTLTNFVVGPKGGSMVEQLDELKSLAGNLRENYLAVKCSGTPQGIVNCPFPLTHMIFLEVLEIECLQGFGSDEVVHSQSALLESLQPPANLRMLSIMYFEGLSYPSWLHLASIRSSLPNIVHISLSYCKCVSLPQFGLLPSLQFLGLEMLSSLEYIYHENDDVEDEDNSSSLRARQLFPSLKVLQLEYFKELKGIGRMRRTREVESVASLSSTPQHVPVLEELHIDCHCLHIDFTNQFHTLENLKTWKLLHCEWLKTLPEWIGGLTALEHLEYTIVAH